MYEKREDVFYYLTVCNENYAHPKMPEGVAEGVLQGIYRYRAADGGKATVQLFGSGPIFNEALRAQEILADEVPDQGRRMERYQLQRTSPRGCRHRTLEPVESGSAGEGAVHREGSRRAQGPIIAATDYVKTLPDQLSPWLRERLVSLGTDGFGRSDNRQYLRRHFENDAESIAAAALSKLARDGKFDGKKAKKAILRNWGFLRTRRTPPTLDLQKL